jgi:hypothetical protein
VFTVTCSKKKKRGGGFSRSDFVLILQLESLLFLYHYLFNFKHPINCYWWYYLMHFFISWIIANLAVKKFIFWKSFNFPIKDLGSGVKNQKNRVGWVTVNTSMFCLPFVALLPSLEQFCTTCMSRRCRPNLNFLTRISFGIGRCFSLNGSREDPG